jgi:Rrf2 family protein
MKLSTKGRYGLRLMLDLAEHHGNGPVKLKDVALRQDISEKYLWHLIPLLKRAGLITSARGSHGGYTLSRQPQAINLLEVISALEGMYFSACAQHPSSCTRSSSCVAREMWTEAAAKIDAIFASFTLGAVVERHKHKQTSNYVI